MTQTSIRMDLDDGDLQRIRDGLGKLEHHHQARAREFRRIGERDDASWHEHEITAVKALIARFD
ncbi:MAG: hypothetical protein OXC11_11045 [Rhodospirillales bacterium]|nr:hypothetical protein [Rhodospirillales bacterium]